MATIALREVGAHVTMLVNARLALQKGSPTINYVWNPPWKERQRWPLAERGRKMQRPRGAAVNEVEWCQ